MHAYSPSSTLETFSLSVNTSAGVRKYSCRQYNDTTPDLKQLQFHNTGDQFRSMGTRPRSSSRTSNLAAKRCFTPRQRFLRIQSLTTRRSWSSGSRLEKQESLPFVAPHLGKRRHPMSRLARVRQASSSTLARITSRSPTHSP